MRMIHKLAHGVAPPVAGFTSDVATGTAPLTVQFTNTSAGESLTYSWNFGDAGTSTATNPSHVFVAAGDYTVTLTVTNPGGQSVVTHPIHVDAA